MEKHNENPSRQPPKQAENHGEINEPEVKRGKILHVIADELTGIQKRISKMPSALKEMLSPGKVKAFFEKIFGKENRISSFLSLIASSLAEKFEFLNKVKISWSDFENQLKIAAEKAAKLPPDEVLETVNYVCVPAILAGPKLVKQLHEKGVNVAVWGVSEKQIQKAIVETGADLVITDRPDIEVQS